MAWAVGALQPPPPPCITVHIRCWCISPALSHPTPSCAIGCERASERLSAYRIHNLFALSASAGCRCTQLPFILPYPRSLPFPSRNPPLLRSHINSRIAHSVVTCDCFMRQPHPRIVAYLAIIKYLVVLQ